MLSAFSEAALNDFEDKPVKKHFEVYPTEASYDEKEEEDEVMHKESEKCEAVVDAILEIIHSDNAPVKEDSVATEAEDKSSTSTSSVNVDELLPLSKTYSPEEVRAFFENLKV